MIERAEGLHRQFFQPAVSARSRRTGSRRSTSSRPSASSGSSPLSRRRAAGSRRLDRRRRCCASPDCGACRPRRAAPPSTAWRFPTAASSAASGCRPRRFELDRSELESGCLHQPEQATLTSRGTEHVRHHQTRRSAARKGEAHPPLPPDALIILPVRQAVLFPGHDAAVDDRAAGVDRRRPGSGAQPSACSASCCRPTRPSRTPSPSTCTRSARSRASCATSPRPTAPIMRSARACGASASSSSSPAFRSWRRGSRRSASRRC